MDGSSDREAVACQRCRRPIEVADGLCPVCADLLEVEPAAAGAPAADEIEPASFEDNWERDLRSDVETTWWSHFVGGVLLLLGSVGVFFVCLVLLGGFGAWLGGVLAFTTGSFALAYFFGGHKAGQSL